MACCNVERYLGGHDGVRYASANYLTYSTRSSVLERPIDTLRSGRRAGRIRKDVLGRSSTSEVQGRTVKPVEYETVEAKTYLDETFWKNIPKLEGNAPWMDDNIDDPSQQLRLQALNHVSVKVQNVVLMEKFYTKVLGFVKLPRPSFPFGGSWLTGGGLFLHLIEDDPTVPSQIRDWREAYDSETPEPWYIRRGFHKAFLVDDLEATEDRLRHWGIEFDKFIVPGTGAAQIFFFDPEGNGIEVGSQYRTVEDILKQEAH